MRAAGEEEGRKVGSSVREKQGDDGEGGGGGRGKRREGVGGGG